MADGLRDKLIAAKQAWARAGRLLTGETAPPGTRLPPGQKLVQDWPILDLGIQPEITLDKFRLVIDGAVDNPVTLDWSELMALPQSEMTADMHCVTQWSNYDNRWRGVSAATILALASPKAACRHVIFHSFDEYTTNLSLAQFHQADVMLVHHWNDAPITRAHGGPLRGMVPRYYLWKSAKWLVRIEFSDSDQPGFWETRGYHNNADPWLEERYS
ncbi:MAG: sulfite oxidase-like oxidoreductase [Acidocella sp.]|nr:sulfite oxidase-like oxidoreductase [Acidocella sp.]